MSNLLMNLAPAVQESQPVGVPIWVVIIIVVVLLLIYWWALGRSTVISRPEEEREEGTIADPELEKRSEPEPVPAAMPEPTPAAMSAPEPTPEPEPEPPAPDDLKRIEGIGPKIQSILNEADITTFAQLAATSVADLERIVREEAGIRVAFPDTWPEQAALAAAGDWAAFEKLTEDLKGGRRVE